MDSSTKNFSTFWEWTDNNVFQQVEELKEKEVLETFILDQEKARRASILPKNYTDGNDGRRSLFERRTRRISAAESV